MAEPTKNIGPLCIKDNPEIQLSTATKWDKFSENVNTWSLKVDKITSNFQFERPGASEKNPLLTIQKDGSVKAAKFTGDGSQLRELRINDKLSVKDALDKKLDKCGGTVTGSLTIENNVSIGTKSQKAKLDVNGTVNATKFTGDGSEIILESKKGKKSLKETLSRIVEGEDHLYAIRGIVNKNGNQHAGEGFVVKKEAKGVYLISFARRFSQTPAASVTQIYKELKFSAGGRTTDNAVICGLNREKVKVKTGDGNGNASDRWFTFIIMGPR